MRLILLNHYNRTIHHKILSSITRMCKSYNIEFVLLRMGSNLEDSLNYLSTINYDILMCNDNYIDYNIIPEHVKIIYGPQHFILPEGPLIGNINKKLIKRAVYNTLSEWNTNVFKEVANSLIVPLVEFPYSIDTELFKPDNESKKYEIDCILYSKNRKQNIIDQVLDILKFKNINFKHFQYNHYNESEYLYYLKSCKFMLVINGSESQGYALQEAMSCNIPLLVLDATSLYDTSDSFLNLKPKKLLATSVPYWCDECGIKMTDINYIPFAIDFMIKNYIIFNPRKFILQNLSDYVCMKRILDYFNY